MENQYYIFWARICSLRYPAGNMHATCCHLWHARLYNIFPRYVLNDTIFGKRRLLDTKCMFRYYLQLLSETFLILRRTESDMITNAHRPWYNHTLLLSYFSDTGIFSTDSRKNTCISNLMEIRPVGAELFHVDGQTDTQTERQTYRQAGTWWSWESPVENLRTLLKIYK